MQHNKTLILLIFFLFLGLVLQWGQTYFKSKDARVFSNESMGYQKNVSESKQSESALLRVHIAGAVFSPGVYDVDDNQRVLDVLTLAGGPTGMADLDQLNLVAKVKDGQRILVPHKTLQNSDSDIHSTQPFKSVLININQASVQELTALSGVGIKTAELIIAFRQQVGSFTSLDQLLQIKGIGPKTLAKLRPQLTLY